ncbi:hypothetical protein J4H46_04125 [Vibrio alginolyticus]|uniref:KAP family P-loop NTPase fold protein n=1 Tax=Vibrio TaxID=662 RepID=UPI0019677C2E|nr:MULTISPECIES: P-loop NTPase fold protein [Vibrio]EIV8672296.1 hypothetical protein [Vibrio parahaemolyticus]EJL6722231.1 hypothetical protein [Vibrio alginolyticus]MBN2998809.1 hypothetical protein [Vibrio alginolyticus]MBT0097741.1 hypothetical protein [Vibrio alginolyticus]MCK8112217.1 KAP family NTPase [Vibrio sp. 2CM40D]
MVQVKHASKYKEWRHKYNWSTSRTGREEYGKFLLSVLTAEKNGFVLNLNGSWGSGKTQFLRRLYIELAEQSYPVVYIDAWESDFLQDPLVVVCTEILNQLGYLFDNAGKDGRKRGLVSKLKTNYADLQSSFDKLLKAGRSLSKGYELLSSDGTGSMIFGVVDSLAESASVLPKMKGVNETNLEILETLRGEQNQLVQAMKDIRNQVSIISGIMHDLYELNLPLVIFVDELDRCRPDYAIKMLEIIKHFFDVKGCAFLVATDTEALEKSIKAVYGNEFASDRYLRRFFNQRIKLPKPSIYEFVSGRNIDFKSIQGAGLKLFPFNDPKIINRIISATLDRREIELRDAEQVLGKIEASLNYIASNRLRGASYINVAVLTYGIVEQHLGEVAFEGRTNRNINEINLKGIKLFDSIDIGDFINSQLKTVTISNSFQEYNFAGGSHHYNEARDILTICATSTAKYSNREWSLIKAREDLREQFDSWKSNPGSHWLWGDYKSLIGLTSHIE